MKVSKPIIIVCIALLLLTGYIQFFTGKKKPKVPVPAVKQEQVKPAGKSAPAKPGQTETSSAPGKQAPTAAAQSSAKAASPAPAEPQPKPQFETLKVGWDADPFALPIFKDKKKKEAGSAVRLVAIVEKGGSRVAVIDKDVVRRGDLIGNEKVVEIGKDRVVLSRGGITRTLVLADPDTMVQDQAPARDKTSAAREPAPPRVPAKEELPPREKAMERAK